MQRVAEDCQRFIELYRWLDQVLREQSWSVLGDVDAAIFEHLQATSAQALSEQAQMARARLKLLHDQARVACADECERLRHILNSHLQSAVGRSAYQQFSEG